MLKLGNMLAAAALLTAATAFTSAQAHAGGFLADTFVKPFNPKLAKKLDKKHAEMGKPLDKLARVAFESVLKGPRK